MANDCHGTGESGRAAVARRDSLKLGGTAIAALALGGEVSDRYAGTRSRSEPSGVRDDRIGRFARWAADLDLGDVPNDVVRKTELQIGNAMAAAAAGAATDELGVPTSGDGATVVRGGGAGFRDAVFANTINSIRHDYDSYLFAAHASHGSVFPALAVCETRGLDGRAFVEHVVVANELAGRLGGSVLVGPNNGQLVSFVHGCSAAVVTARADGDAAAIDAALRLALFSPTDANPAGFLDGDGKLFTAAIPAMTGLRLGEMATRGARGAAAALQNFHANEAFLPLPELLDGWGESWVTRSISYKPSPGAAYVLSPLSAFDAVLAQTGIDPGDVDSVTVEAPILAKAVEGLSDQFAPRDRLAPVGVNFSIRNTLGLRAAAGEVSPWVLSQSKLDANAAAIRSFADLVTVEHDWSETVATFDALGAGIDVTPLIRDRGLVETVMAVSELSDAYGTVDTHEEAISLLRSDEAWDLLTAIGQLGWDTFDMARADFDDLDFSFGSTVTVTAGGERYSRHRDAHVGASARPDEEQRDVVAEKFTAAFGDAFDVIEDLHDRDLRELTDVVWL